MRILSKVIDFILYMDKYLDILIQNYGSFVYLILFLVIFCETGLVVLPFLPGDSLLFIAGAFAARGMIRIGLLFFLLSAAAILGDSFNYLIGRYVGDRISPNSRLIKKDYINKTREFYTKHGGKTIILARFVPIVRTFAPFIAGVGKMNYTRFLMFNIVGGVLWVGLITFSGYYFGKLSFVQDNLTWVILGIIFLSILPGVIEFFRGKNQKVLA